MVNFGQLRSSVEVFVLNSAKMHRWSGYHSDRSAASRAHCVQPHANRNHTRSSPRSDNLKLTLSIKRSTCQNWYIKVLQLSRLSVSCYVKTVKKYPLYLNRADFMKILSVPQNHCGSHNMTII